MEHLDVLNLIAVRRGLSRRRSLESTFSALAALAHLHFGSSHFGMGSAFDKRNKRLPPRSSSNNSCRNS